MNIVPIKDLKRGPTKFDEYNDPVLEKNIPHYKLRLYSLYLLGGMNSYAFTSSYFSGKTNFLWLFLSLLSLPFLQILKEENVKYQKEYNIVKYKEK